MFFDYNDVNFNARLSLLKSYDIFQNSVIKERFLWKISSMIGKKVL